MSSWTAKTLTTPFQNADESRNNVVFGILALGEGWHNTHHAFPTSARHGLRWWQFDISYYFICLLSRIRLAWKVRVPSDEAQENAARNGPEPAGSPAPAPRGA